METPIVMTDLNFAMYFYTTMFGILYSSIYYSAVLFIPRNNEKLFWEIATRVASSVHAIVSTFLCSSYLYFRLTNIYLLFYTNSLVYVISDISILYLKRKYIENDRYTWFHHILMLFGLNYYTFVDFSGYNLARCFLTEMSTPFLNHSWKLYKTNQYNLTYYSASTNEKIIVYIFFVLSFFVFRIVNLTHFLFTLDYGFNYIVLLSLVSLNYYWFYKIVCKLIKFMDFISMFIHILKNNSKTEIGRTFN